MTNTYERAALCLGENWSAARSNYFCLFAKKKIPPLSIHCFKAVELIFKIMKRFSAKPEETIYIGDSPSDAKAADAAGCQFIGYGQKEKFPNHKSIQDLSELCEIFK